MKNTLEFIYYNLKYQYINNIAKTDLYDAIGVPRLDDVGIYQCISDAIEEKRPLCIGKIGGSEDRALASHYFRRREREAYKQLCLWSGFFPKEYDEAAFCAYYEVQRKAIEQLDVILSYPKKYEALWIRKFASKDLKICEWITPWMEEKSWMECLRGKRVLVIHPFSELIEEQYAKREKLFTQPDKLPEFELHTIKAVQTIADSQDDRFGTWMEALDYMTAEAAKVDFDVALIGCGAYGLPLAARIKQMGKIGLHCGGELQTYFGIRGKRWDVFAWDKFQDVCNEHWVYPGEREKPSGAQKVEDGCYW